MDNSENTSKLGIALNSILFLGKIVVGLYSGSIAVLSDAINSFTDIFASIGVWFAVRISDKKADLDHPFGHHRAEPIAGLIVAILVCVVGMEIVKSAISGFFSPAASHITLPVIIVMVFTIIVKLFMSIYFIYIGGKYNRPAIKASGVDSRSDVFISSVALVSILFSQRGYLIVEYVAAFFIGLIIMYSGYKIAKENVDYLMGKCPPLSMIEEIRRIAIEVPEVKGLNDLHAHYVGNYIHVELHIEVSKNASTKKSHDIGKKVERAVESLSYVDKVFIHIDPI